MKKLFMTPLLGLLLASCVRDVEDVNVPGPEGSEAKQFLSVSIVSAGSSTRAETTMNKGFKDGTEVENTVNKVRFYFFTLEGEPAPVKYNPGTDGEGTYQSYSEWLPTDQAINPDPNDNIARIVTAKVVINTANKDKVPRYMVAVLNPTELYMGKDGANLSYEELEAVIKTHNTAASTSDDKGFVMSNSKYIDKEGQEATAVDVTKHIRTSEQDAEDNPVILYVERVVARMDLSISAPEVEVKDENDEKIPNVYDTKVVADINGATDVEKDQPIYVKFLGWNVTATTDKSWLVKKVNPAWDIENLFGWTNEPWSEYLRFRSYWAINPDDVEFGYGDFGQALPEDNPDKNKLPYTSSETNLANALSFDTAQRDGKWVTYMEENAANPEDNSGFQEKNDNSKVIIAAQLVDADGKPITLVKWGFNYYTLDGIKTAWAAALKGEVFKRTAVAGGGYKFEDIKPTDIEFVTAGKLSSDFHKTDEVGRAPEKKGRYNSYPQIVKREGEDWTLSADENAAEAYQAANERVQQMGPAKIWNSGYTYYYFDIAHLGAPEKPGEFGVVRNHIYDADITEIVGLGTPVFDPDEIIYPEKPEEEDSMIAAEINILSWRIVKKTFKLDW